MHSLKAMKPNAAFKPRLICPHKNDWPTLTEECGISQSLKKLRRNAAWWLDNSDQEVKM